LFEKIALKLGKATAEEGHGGNVIAPPDVTEGAH